MEQSFIEKIFTNYSHLRGKYIGCFCKDQMEQLSNEIKKINHCPYMKEHLH